MYPCHGMTETRVRGGAGHTTAAKSTPTDLQARNRATAGACVRARVRPMEVWRYGGRYRPGCLVRNRARPVSPGPAARRSSSVQQAQIEIGECRNIACEHASFVDPQGFRGGRKHSEKPCCTRKMSKVVTGPAAECACAAAAPCPAAATTSRSSRQVTGTR